MSIGNTTLTWVEQSPLVMGVAADAAQAARLVRDGADVVDLGRASGAVVRDVRHSNPGVPVAADVSGGADAAGDVVAAGAGLLYASDGATWRELAVLAAKCGAAVVCSIDEAERMVAAGIARERVLVTPAWRHGIDAVRAAAELAGGDWPVLLTVSCDDVPETGAEVIAVAAYATTAGVRVLRTDRVTETRRTVDMIASIAGTRPPATVRRALA